MLDFFREHKFVSGSISVMLALLLLPLYALISSVVESARYRSAQEQLSELTFLGEMAILADYVDFLASDYSLYAYEAEDADILKESFEKYMKKAESAGGVDTTKLNKLFGVDIEKCDIRYMYSIADPDVLKYQIRSNGRFSLPIKILNEFVLSDILSELEKKLKTVNSKLTVVKNCADAVKDATGGIKDFQTLQGAKRDLKTALNKIYGFPTSLANLCVRKYYDVDWNILNVENEEKREALEDAYVMLQSDVSIDTYRSETDSMGDICDYMLLREDDFLKYFELTEEERAEYTIEIKDLSEKLFLNNISLDAEGKAACKDVLTVVEQKARAVYPGLTSLTKDNYHSTITDISDIAAKRQNVIALYGECGKLLDYAYSYSSYYKAAVKLKEEYDIYLNSFSGIAEHFNSMIESYDSAVAMMDTLESDEITDQLNTDTEDASKAIQDYNQHVNNDVNGIYYTKQNEAKKKRLESYHKALENVDFASIGTTFIQKFATEALNQNFELWKDNLKDKVDDLHLDIQHDYTESILSVSFDDFIKEMKTLQNFDVNRYNETLIEEYDFYTAHNTTLDDKGGALDFANDIDSFITEEYDKYDEKTGEFPNNDKEYVSKDSLYRIYGPLLYAAPGSVLYNADDEDNPWFEFDDGECYYLSENTIVMLFAFLVGSAIADSDSDLKQTLDLFKQIFTAIKNLKPNDIMFNNHIGTSTNSLVYNGNVFPSQSIYYNGNRGWRSFDNVMIQGTSGGYAAGLIGNTSEFPLNSYYIGQQTAGNENLYTRFWGGREPGEDVMLLVDSTARIIDDAEKFFDNIMSLNIIKAMKTIVDFVSAIKDFLVGIIMFILDIIQLISGLISDNDNTVDLLQYIMDQLYIGAFAANSFTSRASAAGCDNENEKCMYKLIGSNHCSECFKGKGIFDGAEMEYILGGDPCEIENQHKAYYAIMVIRIILDFAIVAATTNPVIKTATSIPIAGPIILVLLVFAEANVDMMFLLSGVKVPVIKTKMSLEPDFKNIDNLVSSFKHVAQRTQEGKLTWKMSEPDKNGKRHRIYKKNQTAGDMFNESLQDAFHMDSKSTEGLFALDYDWYINILLLFYPENVKLGRICDLMQMHGIEDCDDDFRLENCYTYVYADVRAEYSPLLPMITEGGIFPDIRNVQLNGY